MHYGKYASMYLRRTFFFDSNPPLGKMMVALGGYLSGYQGDFGFDKIGFPYPEEVPVAGLRFFPALFGSALSPTVYLIVCELGMSHWAGGLAGLFMLLGMKSHQSCLSVVLKKALFCVAEKLLFLSKLYSFLANTQNVCKPSGFWRRF